MSETSTGRRTGITLDEYLDHRARVGEDEALWENNGWCIRGTAGGREIVLWMSPYLVKGFSGGPYRIDRASVSQTLLFGAGVDQPRGQLTANRFTSVGWDPDELLPWDAWTVTGDGSEVVWDGPGRRFTSRLGRWHIVGDHAGVGADVQLEALAEPLWLTDPDEPLGVRHDRWFIANASATGTLTVGGRTVELTGHAVHERHIHLGRAHDPVVLLRDGGATWHTGHSNDVSYAILARPSMQRFWAQATVDGVSWALEGPGEVETVVTEMWVDPVTSFSVPRAWRVVLRGPEGTLELRTTTSARAYYPWNWLRRGITVLYWWLCWTEGTFIRANGETVVLEPMRSAVHLNRTFHENRDPDG